MLVFGAELLVVVDVVVVVVIPMVGRHDKGTVNPTFGDVDLRRPGAVTCAAAPFTAEERLKIRSSPMVAMLANDLRVRSEPDHIFDSP
jgi:hypothetical protein